ncbi:MAG: hypothetical protein QW727_02305 [Candidatus Pacearchaeota archaeon]
MEKIKKFRTSILKERKEFYDNEFLLTNVKKWFEKNCLPFPQLCAVDAGSDTGIIINKKLKNKMLYFPFGKLLIKIKKYYPEDIYYDRNTYKNPQKSFNSLNFKNYLSQELVFDVDSSNIKCNHRKNEIVCSKCISKAYIYSIKMKKELEKKFSKVKIVYSGRGFHIHILDKEAFFLSKKTRLAMSKKFAVKFPIDEWVSSGNISLIRIPYSLNSLVSRIVIPLEKEKFNERKTIPMFLRS